MKTNLLIQDLIRLGGHHNHYPFDDHLISARQTNSIFIATTRRLLGLMPTFGGVLSVCLSVQLLLLLLLKIEERLLCLNALFTLVYWAV